MAMAIPWHSRQSAVDTFFQHHPKIPHVIPSSPGYAALRATFMVDNPAVPVAIAQPQTPEDVSSIVGFCVSHNIPFVVRSGGNNLFGKSQVHGALTIDMREIKYCHVDDSRKSARIGGGILAGTLVESLSAAGVVTASGTVHFVGYVGWSTYGGYGPFSGRFGFGFEQILAAKVVTWKGEIIEADQELLRGIRGAGGSFGIIVELTIKVYPLTKVREARACRFCSTPG
jgi:FAD/FMN-containing dehydrogenase